MKQYGVSNISLGGVFVNVSLNELNNEEFKVGNDIHLEFQIEPSRPPSQIKGKVIWKREKELNDFTTGVGVQFTDLKKIDHESIEKFVRINKILDLIPMEHNRTLS